MRNGESFESDFELFPLESERSLGDELVGGDLSETVGVESLVGVEGLGEGEEGSRVKLGTGQSLDEMMAGFGSGRGKGEGEFDELGVGPSAFSVEEEDLKVSTFKGLAG